MKGRSEVWIKLLASTAMVSLLFWPSERAEASSSANVTLTLQSIPPEVDVSPGSPGIVTIGGEINCTINGSDQVRVYLRAQSDTGQARVTQSKTVFTGLNGVKANNSFHVTTRVPQGYLVKDTPQVTVSGYYKQGEMQYNIPSVQQTIEIQPYYNIGVDTPPSKETDPGGFVDFPIVITNMGNVEDTYEFIILNLEDLCYETWTIATITPKKLKPGETKTVTLSAQAPHAGSLWRNEVQPFNLRILSQESMEEGGNVKEDVMLVVRQKGIYIPGFNPVLALLGMIMMALLIGRKRLPNKKSPYYLSRIPKGLYGKLSLDMR